MEDGEMVVKPTIAEVQACSFVSWYPLFPSLSLRSEVIKLTHEFVEYLKSRDSFYLPPSHASYTASNRFSDSDDEKDESDFENQDDDDRNPTLEFPYLDQKIVDCIQKFEGAVFPKLNWSAPHDAEWISYNKSLRCTSPTDVYLLLKSSEMIVHDLCNAYSYCKDYSFPQEDEFYLVLKKWYDMRPEREFRCFVRSRQLIAITQRHELDSVYEKYFAENETKIVDSLMAFFMKKIFKQFPLENYTFDAYWTKGKTWRIIDFNPYGNPTDPLLFTWTELEKMDTSCEMRQPTFRFITGSGIGFVPKYMQQYGLPMDIIDLASGNDPQKFVDLIKESIIRQNNETSSDEDDDQNNVPKCNDRNPEPSVSQSCLSGEPSISAEKS